MFELSVEMPFSAAHRICGHPGPCARLHGHNYRAVVSVAGGELDSLGMLVDFGELKRICAEVISALDHSYLNELPEFSSANPTAEVLAQHVHRGVAARLAAGSHPGVRISQVTVYESDRAAATYRE
jgi:6-pyruvoyltetrahydropterin/6-carboxytetrahydropterin synthase